MILKLHSITLILFFLYKNCILNGPDILNLLAIFFEIIFIFFIVFNERFWGGYTNVASPEWTPAYSICSEIA